MTNAPSSIALTVPVGARPDPARAQEIVESYTPVDVVDAYYKERYLDLIARYPGDFANRYNYNAGVHGHITSQAFVYHRGRNAIALMHHKKLDIWIGQGGHVEPGDDDFIATARREAEEEAGFRDLRLIQDTPIDLDIHGFPAKGDQPDHIHYDIRWLFETDDDALRLNEGEGLRIEWVPVADLRAKMPMWLSNSRLIRRFEAMFPG
jgi:8-oxo-dGTP pyrophosphatase MutT (NUDIX family)